MLTKIIINSDHDCAYGIHESPILFTTPLIINDKINSHRLMIDLSGMTEANSVDVVPAPDFDYEESAGIICHCDTLQEVINKMAEIMNSSDFVVWAGEFSGGPEEW